MDADLLRSKGVQPVNIRSASVLGFGLRIGQRATLVSKPGFRCYGVVMELNPCRNRTTVFRIEREGLP